MALKPKRYSYADIKKITNQFQDKLGEGGYGAVYKGKLSKEVYVTLCPDEMHSTCNCRGAYVHQVPL